MVLEMWIGALDEGTANCLLLLVLLLWAIRDKLDISLVNKLILFSDLVFQPSDEVLLRIQLVQF